MDMVAFMPFPAALPVHPIFMKQDSKNFHADDGGEGDENIDHHELRPSALNLLR